LLDLRLAFRSLRAAPVVTVVVILSLAMGIGANTAIFSLLNSVLLRALPVVEPERLTLVSGGLPVVPLAGPRPLPSYTYATWEGLTSRATLFDAACAWNATRFDLA